MSLMIGVLVDVSGSMRQNIQSRGPIHEEGGTWARSIFRVVDNLIKHDVSSSNKVFTIGFGARNCPIIFDLLNTINKVNRSSMYRSVPGKKEKLDKILNILETNGAPNVRRWAKMDVMERVVTDSQASIILDMLHDHTFCQQFILKCLPPQCKSTSYGKEGIRNSATFLGRPFPYIKDRFDQGTADSVKDAVVKGLQLLIVNVGSQSVLDVHTAREILHGCIDEQDLSDERVDDLMEVIDPFIYGRTTPMIKALEHARNLFGGPSSMPRRELTDKDKLAKILDKLETSGAPNVRKWVKMDILRSVVTSSEASTLHEYLYTHNCGICPEFIHNCLPPQCGPTITGRQVMKIGTAFLLSWSFPVIGPILSAPIWSSIPLFSRAGTRCEVREAVEKGLMHARYCVTDKVEPVLEVHDARQNQHGWIDEDRSDEHEDHMEVMDSFMFDPHHGNYEDRSDEHEDHMEVMDSLCLGHIYEDQLDEHEDHMEVIDFSISDSNHDENESDEHEDHDGKCSNLLLVLSDGHPTDSGVNPFEDFECLGIWIACCYITEDHISEPKRLYSELNPDWDEGAKFMFNLSSTITTQDLPRTIFIKRGWQVDITNNETKLFFQVNHPDILKDVCQLARDVVCSQDALSDVLTTISLDLYINGTNKRFGAEEQEGQTCYANASATVMHLAMKRIAGREGGYPDFFDLRELIIERYGTYGYDTLAVLEDLCPKYRLRYKQVDALGACKAITKKRPVLARFRLTNAEWNIFDNFFDSNPRGILSADILDITKRSSHDTCWGHAVVLTSYNSECLRLMDSRGIDRDAKGFFCVANAKVLGLEFTDVYWTSDDLTDSEKETYDQRGGILSEKLLNSLKGLQEAVYKCPSCKVESKVTEYTGNIVTATCPQCGHTFDAEKAEDLVLNMYLTSLSR